MTRMGWFSAPVFFLPNLLSSQRRVRPGPPEGQRPLERTLPPSVQQTQGPGQLGLCSTFSLWTCCFQPPWRDQWF